MWDCLALILALSGLPVEAQRDLAIREAACALVIEEAEVMGLDPSLALAVAWHESRFFPDASSPKGAIGVMQIVPRYWCPDEQGNFDYHTPSQVLCDSIHWGIHAILFLMDELSLTENEALCAYNSGKITRGRCRFAYPRIVRRFQRRIRRLQK